MTYDYVIIGGGCYGSYYVRQLLEAREREKVDWTRIAVLDRDGNCAVAQMDVDDVDVVVTEWTAFGKTIFASPDVWMTGHLVPAPIAPHIVMHWLKDVLSESRTVDTLPWPSPAPSHLPFSNVADNGALVLSWAPGLCPTNCVEPRKCPLTRSTRDWEMSDTVRDEGSRAGLDVVEAFICRHHAYGVGTIEFSSLWDALQRIHVAIDAAELVHLGVATVSSCHGLMDVLRVSDDRNASC